MTLQSRNVAITRGPRDAAEFARVVKSEGGRALTLPTIRLVGRGDDVSARYMRASGEYDPDYTVFMSSRAVGLLLDDAARNDALDGVKLAVANTTVVAVGPKTAAALEGRGIRVNAMPESVYSSVGVGEVMSRMDRAKKPRAGAPQRGVHAIPEGAAREGGLRRAGGAHVRRGTLAGRARMGGVCDDARLRGDTRDGVHQRLVGAGVL